MPALVTGTVVHWEVVPEGEQKNPRVKYKDAEDISVFVADEHAEASAIAPAIIAKYILKKKDNHAKRAGRRAVPPAAAPPAAAPPAAAPPAAAPPAAAPPADDGAESVEDLLEDSRKGLLQVVGIRRTIVTPPPLP